MQLDARGAVAATTRNSQTRDVSQTENGSMSQGGFGNPAPGQHMRFIRYVRTRDGWTTEIRRGQVEERCDTVWRVRVLDEVQDLPKTEWSIYHP